MSRTQWLGIGESYEMPCVSIHCWRCLKPTICVPYHLITQPAHFHRDQCRDFALQLGTFPIGRSFHYFFLDLEKNRILFIGLRSLAGHRSPQALTLKIQEEQQDSGSKSQHRQRKDVSPMCSHFLTVREWLLSQCWNICQRSYGCYLYYRQRS